MVAKKLQRSCKLVASLFEASSFVLPPPPRAATALATSSIQPPNRVASKSPRTRLLESKSVPAVTVIRRIPDTHCSIARIPSPRDSNRRNRLPDRQSERSLYP
jgi:hypothetical protein